jgi:prepilin-type N-terminal cleavage/methylation domain-containing protein
MPERRAFTLLEMVVTLGIVALAATLVVPRLAGRAAGDLLSAADDVAHRCTEARWRALVENRRIEVALDGLPAGVAVEVDVASARTFALAFDPLPAALPRMVVLRDASGRHARVTVPPGLGPLTIDVGAGS